MMTCDMNGCNMTFLVQWVGGFFGRRKANHRILQGVYGNRKTAHSDDARNTIGFKTCTPLV